MALSKSFIAENGIHTEYHKISEVIVNTSRDTEKESKLLIKVDSYVSQAYRTTASAPASSKMYQFDITVEEEESMGIRQLAYNKLKELTEWEGVLDV